MTDNSADNKRIAKNTLMLYVRMFLTMAVALYTSRVVLQQLGVEDYGIYSVVAGFVSMFSFVNSALTNATQRFLTFAIGQRRENEIRKTLCMSINIHVLISILFVVLAEAFGVWFLNHKMTIPTDRIIASNVVFQASVIATVALIMSTPYNAYIVAEERMSAFAWISVLDVSLKLLIVYLLKILPYDNLIIYSVLVLIVQLVLRQIYAVYCSKNFKYTKYHFLFDKELFKKMMAFSGWSLFGNLASAFSGQGVNVILNLFCGPIVNAARGICNQVSNAVVGFTSNLLMAINPQITKSYSVNDKDRMFSLIFKGAKFSFYLTLILALPLFWTADSILHLWLVEVPEYTVIFVKITLMNLILGTITGPFVTAAQATGDIKLYQIVVGGILLLVVPFSYVFMALFKNPIWVYVVDFSVGIMAHFARIFMMKKMVNLSMVAYSKRVIIPTLSVFAVSIILSWVIYVQFDNSLFSVVLMFLVSILIVALSISTIGLNNSERRYIYYFLRSKIKR